MEVVVEGGRDGSASATDLTSEGDGYFSGRVAGATVGTLYRYRLDGGESYPDPASRFQPDGPHGPSRVVDPAAFRWTDGDWEGLSDEGQVLYEMHVGTFTPEGTWEAAARELPSLADLGVTAVELMPVADFAGRFGWGYDGVDWFAPTRLYGEPDDFRRFVDRAHALGLGVLLDVVYNHYGPEGCYLRPFADAYFSDRHRTEWGEAPNFDGPDSGPVREFVLASAVHWVAEYHLDGLRADAVLDTYDDSPEHVLKEVVRRARGAAGGRSTLMIAEDEGQDPAVVRPHERGGFGFDMAWNEDFHHASVVALLGRREGYYADYRGTPQEMISAQKYGYLFQGQVNTRQGKRRGGPALDIEPRRFINYLENHDQVANSAWGDRLHRLADAGRYRAMTALLLLGTGTPMLFQGQEFAATAPFVYFNDTNLHPPQGHVEFLRQFRNLGLPEVQAAIAADNDPGNFGRSKLDPTERRRHAAAYDLHRDLLTIRRGDPVLRAPRRGGADGAVLGPEAFVLRHFGEAGGDDRLLVVNLGPDLHLDPAPEPLLAPPGGTRWSIAWSSEDPRYGGSGTPPLESDDENWRLPGHATVLLAPRTAEPHADG